MIDRGELSIDQINNANIPVDIHLDDMDDSGNWDDGKRPDVPKWRLQSDNYMPRRGSISEEGLEVYSDDKEELLAIIRDKIRPLYKTNLCWYYRDDELCLLLEEK